MKLLWYNLVRVFHLLRVLSRHGLSWLAGRAGAPPWLARRLPDPHLDGPERLRSILEEMGGTFVKFGQMLALQPDIVSLDYCNALFKLLDRVDPFPYSEVERIWTEEIGARPDEVFDRFEREPIATASVGQVHVAWRDGKKWAVKVQRPNVEFQFGSDIRMMVMTVRLIQILHLRFLEWLVEPTTEFIGWTREEIDYRHEARYSERMRRLARNNPAQTVPAVLDTFTTRRTLVVEFLEGSTLISHLRAREEGDEMLVHRLEPPGFSRKRFAANVIDNFLGDAFKNGLYHADLHPANLLILEDSVVGYIDFGITGVMSRHGRRHLVAMTLALAEGDMDVLHEEFLEIAAWNPEADPERFRHGLDRLAAEWYEETGGTRRMRVNFTRIMGDMLTLSRKTGVLPERDIVKYIRSSIAIDGLVTRFEPDFNVSSYLAESCSRFLAWQSRRERFAPEKLLDSVSAGGKILRDAPRRTSALVDRLLDGELPVRVVTPSSPDGSLGPRALFLGVLMVVMAALITFGTPGGEPPGWGFNLWTMEMVFLALTGVLLTDTVRRLT